MSRRIRSDSEWLGATAWTQTNEVWFLIFFFLFQLSTDCGRGPTLLPAYCPLYWERILLLLCESFGPRDTLWGGKNDWIFYLDVRGFNLQYFWMHFFWISLLCYLLLHFILFSKNVFHMCNSITQHVCVCNPLCHLNMSDSSFVIWMTYWSVLHVGQLDIFCPCQSLFEGRYLCLFTNNS